VISLRALIVEDEKTPRELLRDLVPWARHGFDRVETARNGLEALAILEGGEVDLVVTDVRMPKMDGIELSLEVRRRWPECVVIFLSGFSDKEYLKTAIRVQAQDYLDKPIDLAAVEAAVAEAARTATERRFSRAESERDEQVLKELAPLRRQALAQGLFGLGPGAGGPLDDGFAQGPLRALVVVPVSAAPEWPPAVLGRLNSGDCPFPGFAAAPGFGPEILIACDRALASDQLSFDRSVESLLGWLDPQGERGLRIGVSSLVDGPGDLVGALASARSALDESFYRPLERVYTMRPRSERSFELPTDSLAVWRQALEAGDYQAVLRHLDVLEQRALAVRDPDHHRVRRVWLGAMEFVLGFVPAWGPAERSARLAKLAAEFDELTNLPALAAAAKDCFERLFVLSPGELHVGDRVQKARLYIEDKFADPDLTVDVIASHVGFSESYFCTVFKQAQGITVKDFVTRHRIERAKAYLWEKDPPTLADLALKVGFRDPNYFSTVFKRLTGTSPGAYRKKALG
jgi:two-component system response regulator YesN